jgi:hypothetical protein
MELLPFCILNLPEAEEQSLLAADVFFVRVRGEERI